VHPSPQKVFLPGDDTPEEETKLPDDTPNNVEDEDDDLSKPLRVKAYLKQSPVEVELEDGTVSNGWLLIEMIGEEKGIFQSIQATAMKFDKEGAPVGIDQKIMKDLEIDLVSRCLWVPKEDKLVKVDKKFIKSWPGTMLGAIARRCERMNGIGKDADKKLRDRAKKNSTENSATGSK
jgi:hypothetical protein